MKRLAPVALFVVLAAGGFWGAWYFLHSPYYSLYQIGKAIHEHKPRLFLAYVDLDRMIKDQKDDFLAQLLPEQQDAESKQTVHKIISAFLPHIQSLARDRVAGIIADKDRQNLPTSWALLPAASVTTNNDSALVVLSDPESGKRARLGMERYPEDGHWRVVQVDPRDLRKLLEDYLKNN